MYLLDTNILSPLLTNAPPDHLLDRLAALRRRDLYTSSINQGELLYGVIKGQKGFRYFARLHRLLERVQVLSFDSHCAQVYGELRSEMERRGRPLPLLDLMIGSVALGNGLTLVTENERDFEGIPQLQIENGLRRR